MRQNLLAWSLAALSAFSPISALITGRPFADAVPYALLAACLAVGFWVGRALVERLALVSGVLVACLLPTVLSGGHLVGSPLGYPNADAALGIQIAALALLAGVASAGKRGGWFVAAALAASLTVVGRSVAGAALALMLLAAGSWALVGRRVWDRWVPWVGAGSVLLAATAQGWLLAGGSWPDWAVRALSQRRMDLWSEGWELIEAQPLLGHGPGSFSGLAPSAADPDTSAAHSVLVQVWVELGVVGVALAAAVMLAGFSLVRGSVPRMRAVAGAAWAALWLQALVDYTLHFPVVLACAGLVLGVASSWLPVASTDTRLDPAANRRGGPG